MDALRDLMAREIAKVEPRPVPAQPATVTPARPSPKLEPRPSPKPEPRVDVRTQPARREAKIDPVAKATLDRLMAGEIARVAPPPPAAPRPASAPVRTAPPPPASQPSQPDALLPRAAASAPAPIPPQPAPAAARVVPRAAPASSAPPRASWSKLAWPTAQPVPRPAPAVPPIPAPAAAPSLPEPQAAPVAQAAPLQAEPTPEPNPVEDVTPPVPPVLAALFEARAVPGGKGVFAIKAITKGTRLFGDDDWADDEERKSFSALSLQQFEELKPTLRSVFLRYAYNSSLEQITGAFRPELVRDPVNFINHSCDPNAGYDGSGNIVALRGIAPDEEIRMDYGTFTFSFDHEFTCGCQALWCRGKVTAKDWPDLVRAGLRLPAFMRQETAKALWG